MANQEQLALLKRDTKQWNDWRTQHPELLPDLSGGDLSSANLSHAHLADTDLSDARLNYADLSGANLNRAHLGDADLIFTNLNHADLTGADLRGTDLYGADLSDADLSGANLNRASLYGAHLRGTNLARASVWETIFANVDLREVKGLTELFHEGPSHVILYTVQLPSDERAWHFLRGTGVPEEWSAFYHATFLSYASEDGSFAHHLHADLQAQGVRCWLAPLKKKTDDANPMQLEEELHVYEKIFLLLSKHTLSSDWMESELQDALEKEQRQQRAVLFLLCLDQVALERCASWALSLRESRHVYDFTHWADPQGYQQAFEGLLREVKTEG